MTEKIMVENIKCGGCINSIKIALCKLINVQEVDVDQNSQTITISSSLPFDRQTVITQLAKMGYPEQGDNNLLLKAKSFVSCAVGNLTGKINC